MAVAIGPNVEASKAGASHASDALRLALWRLRSGSDAADVVQDVFARLGAGVGSVREPRAFVLTLARRLATDQARRRKVRRADELVDDQLVGLDASSVERVVDAAPASRGASWRKGRPDALLSVSSSHDLTVEGTEGGDLGHWRAPAVVLGRVGGRCSEAVRP